MQTMFTWFGLFFFLEREKREKREGGTCMTKYSVRLSSFSQRTFFSTFLIKFVSFRSLLIC